MNTEAENNLVAYLQQMTDFRRQCLLAKMGDFYCIEEFILKYGRPFKRAPLPQRVTRGAPQQCFQNSAEYVLFPSSAEEVFYCEGFATSVIPIHHAWLVNRKGEVIDRTWADDKPRMGTAYYGVTFKEEFVRKTILRTEKWQSMIDDWANGWPLLKNPEPSNAWRVEI